MEEFNKDSQEYISVAGRYKMPPIPLWVMEEHGHMNMRVIRLDDKTYCIIHGSSGFKAYIGVFIPEGDELKLVAQQTWNGLDAIAKVSSLEERVRFLLGKELIGSDSNSSNTNKD